MSRTLRQPCAAPFQQPRAAQCSVDSPKTAKHGSTLEFLVTIRNLSSKDYTLYPCPDCSNALVPGGPGTYYQLNCEAVGAIKSGRSEKVPDEVLHPVHDSAQAWGRTRVTIASPCATTASAQPSNGRD